MSDRWCCSQLCHRSLISVSLFRLLPSSALYFCCLQTTPLVRVLCILALSLSEKCLEHFDKSGISRTGAWIESHDWLAIAIDKELFIVPSDVSGHNRRPADVGQASDPRIGWWTRSLQPSVERMLVGTIDKKVCEDGEVGFVAVTGTNVLENQQSLVVVLWV